jgi:hypothetical protein
VKKDNEKCALKKDFDLNQRAKTSSFKIQNFSKDWRSSIFSVKIKNSKVY